VLNLREVPISEGDLKNQALGRDALRDSGERVVRDRGGDGDKKGDFDSGKLLRPEL